MSGMSKRLDEATMIYVEIVGLVKCLWNHLSAPGSAKHHRYRE